MKLQKFNGYNKINENVDLILSEKLQMSNVYTYNEPKAIPISNGIIDVEAGSVTEAYIQYTLTPLYDKYGMYNVSFKLIHISLVYEYDYYDVEKDTTSYKNIILEPTDVNSIELTTEFNQLPFYINEISIDMKRCINPNKFKYEIEFGKIKN